MYFHKKIILLVFCNVAAIAVAGQHLDFDSLYQNDPSFKTAIASQPEFIDFFGRTDLVKITIESDLKNLFKNKFKDEYQDAVFRYFLNDTVVVNRDIEIQPRGHMRRKTCYFPPLKLNFPKKDAVLPQIQEFDKVKLVLDCKKGQMYEQYLLSEYYAYKIYNLITDYSFRVRLFELTLIDTSGKLKPMKTYAFILESVDELAERMNSVELETQNIRDQFTNQENLGNVYLFQFLIGNTDWSIPALHNYKLIKSKDPLETSPVAIPYDFDYAGIVNTEYAVPDERLGTESVRERVYRGVCIDESHILNAVERFMGAKERIYAIYEESDLLGKGVKNSSISYLDEFYQIIESEFGLKRHILDQCRE